MKTFIASLAVLGILIAGISVYSVYLENTTDDLLSNLDKVSECSYKEQWEECRHQTDKLIEIWIKNQPVLSMFNDHEDIDEINLSISALKESVKFEDTEHTFKSLEETKILIERIRKNETLSLENILRLSPDGLSCHNML